MPQINVKKGFIHNSLEGIHTKFEAGVHEVSDYIAEHWYTKAHLAEDAPVVDEATAKAAAEKAAADKAAADAEAEAAALAKAKAEASEAEATKTLSLKK